MEIQLFFIHLHQFSLRFTILDEFVIAKRDRIMLEHGPVLFFPGK